MNHSKQTPKPSRALIAAQQRRDRPISKRVMGSVPTERNVGFYPSGERYSLPARADVLCPGGCGYGLCSKRGPCAPSTAPQPAAAPAPEVPRAWKPSLGERVLCKKVTPYMSLTRGREYTVLSPCDSHDQLPDDERDAYVTVLCDDGEADGYPAAFFEPLPASPVSEAAGEWMPEACGWRRLASHSHIIGYGCDQYERFYDLKRGVTVEACRGGGFEAADWVKKDLIQAARKAPTIAQACCAALGMRFEDVCDTGFVVKLGDVTLTGVFLGGQEEAAARAALLAHARSTGVRT